MMAIRRSLATASRPIRRRLPGNWDQKLRDRFAADPAEDQGHPERLAVLRHVRGSRVMEIGCGPRKSRDDFVGVDLTPGGVQGSTGNARGRRSEADIAADGSRLPFPDGAFQAIVARHNLEHYVDVLGTLVEWRRVVEPDGLLVAIVPDEDRYPGRTLDLDPTHYHAFNEAFLARLLPAAGWRVDLLEPCIDRWSLLIVATRAEDVATGGRVCAE